MTVMTVASRNKNWRKLQKKKELGLKNGKTGATIGKMKEKMGEKKLEKTSYTKAPGHSNHLRTWLLSQAPPANS